MAEAELLAQPVSSWPYPALRGQCGQEEALEPVWATLIGSRDCSPVLSAALLQVEAAAFHFWVKY